MQYIFRYHELGNHMGRCRSNRESLESLVDLLIVVKTSNLKPRSLVSFICSQSSFHKNLMFRQTYLIRDVHWGPELSIALTDFVTIFKITFLKTDLSTTGFSSEHLERNLPSFSRNMDIMWKTFKMCSSTSWRTSHMWAISAIKSHFFSVKVQTRLSQLSHFDIKCP